MTEIHDKKATSHVEGKIYLEIIYSYEWKVKDSRIRVACKNSDRFQSSWKETSLSFFFVSLDAVEAGESFQEMHPNHKPENLNFLNLGGQDLSHFPVFLISLSQPFPILWLKFPDSFCAPGCPEEQMTLFCVQYEGKIYCHLHVTPRENWVLGNDCNR